MLFRVETWPGGKLLLLQLVYVTRNRETLFHAPRALYPLRAVGSSIIDTDYIDHGSRRHAVKELSRRNWKGYRVEWRGSAHGKWLEEAPRPFVACTGPTATKKTNLKSRFFLCAKYVPWRLLNLELCLIRWECWRCFLM